MKNQLENLEYELRYYEKVLEKAQNKLMKKVFTFESIDHEKQLINEAESKIESIINQINNL